MNEVQWQKRGMVVVNQVAEQTTIREGRSKIAYLYTEQLNTILIEYIICTVYVLHVCMYVHNIMQH